MNYKNIVSVFINCHVNALMCVAIEKLGESGHTFQEIWNELPPDSSIEKIDTLFRIGYPMDYEIFALYGNNINALSSILDYVASAENVEEFIHSLFIDLQHNPLKFHIHSLCCLPVYLN